MTDGAFSDDGAFHPLATWGADAVMKLFRERLLARLLERHAISEDLVRKLLTWRHPCFSAHVGEAIASDDEKAIEDVACYLVRAPLSLKISRMLGGEVEWGDDDDDDPAEGEMTICHIPPGNPSARHTITIGASAWPAHKAHGDYAGACQ